MPPVKHTNKQPVPAPSVLQTTAQDSQIKNKIKRIEDILEQLEYEKDILISLNEKENAKNIHGRIVGLNVALAILKDEI